MPDTPITAASALVQKVGDLAGEAKRIRAEFEVRSSWRRVAPRPSRLLYLGIIEALDQALVRGLEAARDAIKAMRDTEADEWLRRRLGNLGRKD